MWLVHSGLYFWEHSVTFGHVHWYFQKNLFGLLAAAGSEVSGTSYLTAWKDIFRTSSRLAMYFYWLHRSSIAGNVDHRACKKRLWERILKHSDIKFFSSRVTSNSTESDNNVENRVGIKVSGKTILDSHVKLIAKSSTSPRRPDKGSISI